MSLEDSSGNRKLHSKYCRPFKVITAINKVSVKLILPQVIVDCKVYNAIHNCFLRPYVENKFGRTIETSPPLLLEDEEEILKTRRNSCTEEDAENFSI